MHQVVQHASRIDEKIRGLNEIWPQLVREYVANTVAMLDDEDVYMSAAEDLSDDA